MNMDDVGQSAKGQVNKTRQQTRQHSHMASAVRVASSRRMTGKYREQKLLVLELTSAQCWTGKGYSSYSVLP